ncbi:hypothetical protein ACFY7C_19380 [Streptomyces sp. NPDC012769]|uniref:hypothetical protein n=1 Tax=Streptomyces sp. NPDC012769 TaxID=3364848 RepID=UPI0036D11521
MKRTLAAVTVGVLVAVGCGVTDTDRAGDPGRIVEKDEDRRVSRTGKRTTTRYDYDFTIQRPDGSVYELDVSRAAFDSCFVGSAYPRCLDD